MAKEFLDLLLHWSQPLRGRIHAFFHPTPAKGTMDKFPIFRIFP
jgi:hypothetical protein